MKPSKLYENEFSLKYYSNVDKIENFIYHTFQINENINIVISKFNGNEWKSNSKQISDSLAKKFGEIVDAKK